MSHLRPLVRLLALQFDRIDPLEGPPRLHIDHIYGHSVHIHTYFGLGEHRTRVYIPFKPTFFIRIVLNRVWLTENTVVVPSTAKRQDIKLPFVAHTTLQWKAKSLNRL